MQFIGVHNISRSVELSNSLPAFHSITGCDGVIQFYGIEKCGAWKVYEQHAHLRPNFAKCDLTENDLTDAETFVCRLYLPAYNVTSIYDARFKLFNTGRRDAQSLLPTAETLRNHLQ